MEFHRFFILLILIRGILKGNGEKQIGIAPFTVFSEISSKHNLTLELTYGARKEMRTNIIKYHLQTSINDESDMPIDWRSICSPDWLNQNISLKSDTSTITVKLRILQRNHYDAPFCVRFLFILIKVEESTEMEKENVKILEDFLKTTFYGSHKTRLVGGIDLSQNFVTDLQYQIGNSTFLQIYHSSIFGKIKFSNGILKNNNCYNITILFVTKVIKSYIFRKRFYVFCTKNDSLGGKQIPQNTTSWLIVAIFAICSAVAVFVLYKKKKLPFIEKRLQLSVEISTINTYKNVLKNNVQKATLKFETNEYEEIQVRVSKNLSSNGPVYSEEVSVINFEAYVKSSILTRDLERQYNLLSPSDHTKYSDNESPMINGTNNFYLDLVEYDDARVKLKQRPGDKQCSYINASYINGYKMPKAYIATENPRAEKFETYWRMVWEENVKYIFMLSNNYGEDKNLDQFWPNNDKTLMFSDISVRNLHISVTADFEHRTFSVTRNNEKREIEKMLYTNWPRNGVPLYPQTLIPFVRELLKIPLSTSAPILVQCSNGAGKTGTILLIDISLRMAADQGVLDILCNFQKLRNQKANTVDNVKQYILIHLVVLQLLNGYETGILCCELNEMAVKIIDGEEYKIQMDYLRRMEWQNQAIEMTPEYCEIFVNYPEKNRLQNIFPGDFGRVFLEKYPGDDMSSSYINAVQVDGYRCLGRYIVTQQPMPNTVGDFWRLIIQEHIKVIISLNEVDLEDQTCCEFLPTDGNLVFCPVDHILVSLKKEVAMDNYNIHYLHVENRNKKEELDVEVLNFKKWPARRPLPSSCEEFFSFWSEAAIFSKRSKQVLVTCFDGVTASGVFVALSFIIEKMKVEQKCDVCQAVQIVRRNRKQFLTEECQFVFLFVAAVRFINGFQLYSNFQKK